MRVGGAIRFGHRYGGSQHVLTFARLWSAAGRDVRRYRCCSAAASMPAGNAVCAVAGSPTGPWEAADAQSACRAPRQVIAVTLLLAGTAAGTSARGHLAGPLVVGA
jgi:hypothetical protein